MHCKKAFSLLELLLVLAILSTLASVALPTLTSWQARIEIDRANSALMHAIGEAKLRALRDGHSWTICTSTSPHFLELLPASETTHRPMKDRFPLPNSITFEFHMLRSNELLHFLTISSSGNLIPARIGLLQDGKRVMSYESERLTGGLRRIR